MLDSNHTYSTVISLNSALKKKKENYYPKVYLNKFKYVQKKLIRHIIDDLESFSNDYDHSDDYDEEKFVALRFMFFWKCPL